MHDLQWHVARVDRAAGDAQPRVRVSAPQSIESRRPREKDGPLFNDPAGEYLPVGFLRDGRFNVYSAPERVAPLPPEVEK